MAKYTNDFKRETVEYSRLNGNRATVRKYNIDNKTLCRWIEKYEIGDFSRKQNKNYSLSEKLEIIEHYKCEGKNSTERKYNISNSVFMNWYKILLEYGEEELGKLKPGRKPLGKAKDLTKNEALLKELEMLRMENAALKKLDRLVRTRKK